MTGKETNAFQENNYPLSLQLVVFRREDEKAALKTLTLHHMHTIVVLYGHIELT